MPPLPTLPRRSWLERASDAIAISLIAIGVAVLAGWWLHAEVFLQPFASLATMKANEAACVLLLGFVMIGVNREWAAMTWLAVVPATVAVLSLLETVLHLDLHIDELLVLEHNPIETAHPGRMSAMSACALALASIVLASRALNGRSRLRLLSEASIASIIASAGFSTLMGYAVSLPAVYHWGTHSATAPFTAFALFLLGLGLLVVAWRESLKSEGGPPAWSPMPAVVGCLTLTIILWIGLREREVAYLSAKTQTSMDTLATTISSDFDRQAAMIERLARKWGTLAPGSAPVWDADVRALWEDARAAGCVSIAVVSPALRTVWVYPAAGNEGLLDYDHGAGIDVTRMDAAAPTDPETQGRRVRRAAINAAGMALGPAISGTLELDGRGKGVVIYSPGSGRPPGFVAGEFLYRQFFNNVILDRKLAADYRIQITIGGDLVYDSSAGAPDVADAQLTIERTYPNIFNRRVRLSLTPSAESLEHERRFLPELALGAGFGITLLLGLSVHLARSARAGQRAAEQSNRKLHAENEERRRIEARLKISDERLRLALDSTQIGIFEWSVPTGHVYYSPGLWGDARIRARPHGRHPRLLADADPSRGSAVVPAARRVAAQRHRLVHRTRIPRPRPHR